MVMRTTPFDSKLYSELYGTSEMKAIWDDTSIVQSWLDTEIALAETQAELGLIPAEAAIPAVLGDVGGSTIDM